MEYFERTICPSYLKKNYKNWGKEWEKDKKNDKSFPDKLKKIKPDLIALTNGYCSYCGLKLADIAIIEHFYPKEKKPLLAFYWCNLFISCQSCNSTKSDKFESHKALKPDQLNYRFDYWFLIDFSTGKLEPNPKRNNNEKERVKYTIDLFGLNKSGKCTQRNEQLDFYQNGNDINALSYHFYLKRGKL